MTQTALQTISPFDSEIEEGLYFDPDVDYEEDDSADCDEEDYEEDENYDDIEEDPEA